MLSLSDFFAEIRNKISWVRQVYCTLGFADNVRRTRFLFFFGDCQYFLYLMSGGFSGFLWMFARQRARSFKSMGCILSIGSKSIRRQNPIISLAL